MRGDIVEYTDAAAAPHRHKIDSDSQHPPTRHHPTHRQVTVELLVPDEGGLDLLVSTGGLLGGRHVEADVEHLLALVLEGGSGREDHEWRVARRGEEIQPCGERRHDMKNKN